MAITSLDRLVRAQGGVCYLCGSPFAGEAALQATRDHVVPKRAGGQTKGNSLAAHRVCNNEKGGRYPTVDELAVLDAVNRQMYGSHWVAPRRHARQDTVSIGAVTAFVAKASARMQREIDRRAKRLKGGITEAQADEFNARMSRDRKAREANERAEREIARKASVASQASHPSPSRSPCF